MNTFISGIEQFHFIRPEWLLGLPITLIFWFLLRRKQSARHWSNYISKEMLTALQSNSTEKTKWWKRCLLILCIGSSIAAAGPSWHKQSVPIVKNQKALVLLLDLSPSMLAQDLSPDRLTRAKYKLIDLLRLQGDGQTALIAYAGEAHTVSPLSDDPGTIEALLPALHPSVMPVRGSNTEAAIELAQQLLSDAGLRSGDIIIITDGIANDAIAEIKKSINANYQVSILAVGGTEAAPIPAPNGGFLRKQNGEIVLSTINSRELRSMAGSLGGHFAILTNNDSDIESLLKSGITKSDFENNNDTAPEQNSATYDAWVDMGHWLILLILPFILILFRKGVIYLVPFLILTLISAPNDAYANGFSWKDLWHTRDQQGAKEYQDGEFETAANRFKRKDWSALANYKNGNYQQTISQLSKLNDVTSLYNKGNALAFNNQLEQALKAYGQVLEQQPGHEDALHNRSVIEQLLNQQDQQNKDSKNTENQEQSDKSEESEKSSDNDAQQQEQGKDQQQDSESQQPEDQNQQPSDQQQEQTKSNDTKPSPEQEQEKQTDANSEKQEEIAAEPEQNNGLEDPESSRTALQAENTNEPLKDSSEQWLRTIQDDPSGLLRRKFEYQTRQRAQQGKRQPKSGKAQDRY